MAIRLILVPYDSGHRARRMGCGPLHLVEAGALDQLAGVASTVVETIEATAPFTTEIGSAFELHRAVANAVERTRKAGDLPLVLSGNCNASLGTVAGLQRTGQCLGVVWFDGHGDSNTPETFTGTFLDAMGLSTLTGRCWQALAATVSGFQPVPDEAVLLLGGHGADVGAQHVLAASQIEWLHSHALRMGEGQKRLELALKRMAAGGITRLYLHLDVDVLDARFAMANEFAQEGGLLPDELSRCLRTILARFDVVAAGVASYDPSFDQQDRIREVALDFLQEVARAHPTG